MKKLNHIFNRDNRLSFLGNIFASVLGFGSFILLTRTLSREDLGLWIIFITVATFIDLGRFGLLRGAVVRFVSIAKEGEREGFIGSAFSLSAWITLLLSALFYLIYFTLGSRIPIEYQYVLIYYPLIALSNLSWNCGLSVLQADQEFGKILTLRIINLGTFVLLLSLNMLIFHWGVVHIIMMMVISNTLASIYSAVKRWDGMGLLKAATKEYKQRLLAFGKFSIGTLIGGSLLRSSDAIIIAANHTMGATAVAIYSIPLKLTEVMEIPVRSVAATLFPKLSKLNGEGKNRELFSLLRHQIRSLILLYIPLLSIGFIFAEFWVSLVGGDEFTSSIPQQTVILKIFIVYGLLIPLDRLIGVTLDAINRPDLNLYKVIAMVLFNIIGDIVAVFVYESLYLVALTTLLFTLIGIIIGYYWLKSKKE